jgi:glycosyltransferase involved in cell wall biosynthesis
MRTLQVLFVVDRIDLNGGVSRSLVELLKLLPQDRATYYLYVTSGQPVQRLGLPSHLKVLSSSVSLSADVRRALIERFRQGRLIGAARILRAAAAFRVTGNRGRYLRRLSSLDPGPNRVFDVAIGYGMLDAYCNVFVATSVQAHRRLMWCHINATLYSEHGLMGMDEVYRHFDQIVCVGPSTQVSLNDTFPLIADRTVVADNALNEEALFARAKAFTPTKSCFTLCTVGRITREKGTDLIADAARLLAERGVDFEWWNR